MQSIGKKFSWEFQFNFQTRFLISNALTTTAAPEPNILLIQTKTKLKDETLEYFINKKL